MLLNLEAPAPQERAEGKSHNAPKSALDPDQSWTLR